MPTFNDISTTIILISSLITAIGIIANAVGKPVTFFKKRREREEQKEAARILNILQQSLPQMFLEHDIELKNKYKSDREVYLNEIKAEVLKELQEPFNEVLRLQLELKEALDKVNRSTKDILRQRIMAIYETHRLEGKIPQTMRENLDELYKDYTAQGGNSYITKYYKRMIQWEVIPDANEYHDIYEAYDEPTNEN